MPYAKVKHFYTADQLSKESGISKRTIQHWLKTGKLKGMLVGTSAVMWLIPPSEAKKIIARARKKN